MEWLRPSSARSNVITSASARDRMPRPCCVSCRRGLHTTTRFTRTRLSVIVHPVSSSQLTTNPDRVRSFGGYNKPEQTPCGDQNNLAWEFEFAILALLLLLPLEICGSNLSPDHC